MVWQHELIRYSRTRTRILTGLIPPRLFLFVLGYVMSNLVRVAGGFDFKKSVFPGIVTMSVVGTASFSAISIVWDREFGFLGEMLPPQYMTALLSFIDRQLGQPQSTLATRHEREHERPAAAVLSQGHRPGRAEQRRPGLGGPGAQRPTPQTTSVQEADRTDRRPPVAMTGRIRSYRVVVGCDNRDVSSLRPKDFSCRHTHEPFGPSDMAFRLGLLPRRWVTLEVRARLTGTVTRFPLGMADVGGQWYVVSMLGECNWVRNVRAAEGRATLRRRRARTVRLFEVPVDERAPVIRRYVGRVPGGRPHIPVDRNEPVEAFETIASNYPVFRVVPL